MSLMYIINIILASRHSVDIRSKAKYVTLENIPQSRINNIIQ